MTITQLYETLYTNLVTRVPAITVWQQAKMAKPDVEPWGVITFGGSAVANVNNPKAGIIYFRVWIYKNGDETALVQLAADVKRAINDIIITSPSGGHRTIFHWINTGGVFYDDTLLTDGIDLTFRNVASSL